jgi:hypothetical protein
MNFKLDLNTVNTILMVVILILVIVACVRKSRENFDPYFLDDYCKNSNDLSCLRGSDDAAEGTEYATDWQDLNEMTSLKEWAQSDDSIHTFWTYGEKIIENQLTQSALILFNILDRIIKALELQGESAKDDVEKIKLKYSNFYDDTENANLTEIQKDIKDPLYFKEDSEDKILQLTPKHDKIQKLITENTEILTDEDKKQKISRGDKRDIIKQHWQALLLGKGDYNINSINFISETTSLIDNEKLKNNFVDEVIQNLGSKNKDIALGTLGRN